jgi:hypothetical protein
MTFKAKRHIYEYQNLRIYIYIYIYIYQHMFFGNEMETFEEIFKRKTTLEANQPLRYPL